MCRDIELEWEGIVNSRFRVILSYKGHKIIQVDSPPQLREDDYFTIFWRSNANPENLHYLHEFVNYITNNEDKGIRSLFFFSDFKKHIPEDPKAPPHQIEKVPTELEIRLIEQHGSPKFVRYEIYPELIPNTNLNQTRFTIWAGLETNEVQSYIKINPNEIGVYSNYKFIEDEKSRSAVPVLICNTSLHNVELPVSADFMDIIKNKLNDRRLI
jgi:hypothetical protein